ncbi:uncharacterized protein LOC129259931 [Lytechinus pictus]|uniref:uncharacterized protein LOC129259931 n=1 Tax=Lytechinus pictus TaxID=7653 RepID=UPI0030B9AE1A
MAILTRCCCFTLRNGSIAAAIYSLIQSALALGISSFKIHMYVIHHVIHEMPEKERALFIATCVDVGFFSLLFFFSIILLYGIKNNKRFLFLPYIVCMTVLIILMCVIILLLVVVIVTSMESEVLGLLIVSFFTGLNLYCVLCVTSLYREFKEGRYGMRAIYRAQGGRLSNTDNPIEKVDDINNFENANFIPQYPGPPAPSDNSVTPPPPVPDPVPYSAPMMGAPPPYQPPAYPAENYPKTDVQTA